jgi:hypothetical protein
MGRSHSICISREYKKAAQSGKLHRLIVLGLCGGHVVQIELVRRSGRAVVTTYFGYEVGGEQLAFDGRFSWNHFSQEQIFFPHAE